MKKKELEKTNKELIEKIEKQSMIIVKLNDELATEKGMCKTVYIEKGQPKSTILEDYANNFALLKSMSEKAKNIFHLFGVDKPLDLIGFEDWFNGLDRDDLIGGLKSTDEEAFTYFDSLDLASIKSFYRSSLKEYYDKEKERHIKMLNHIIVEALKRNGGK